MNEMVLVSIEHLQWAGHCMHLQPLYFILPFSMCVMSSYDIPDGTLGAEGRAVANADIMPALIELTIQRGGFWGAGSRGLTFLLSRNHYHGHELWSSLFSQHLLHTFLSFRSATPPLYLSQQCPLEPQFQGLVSTPNNPYRKLPSTLSLTETWFFPGNSTSPMGFTSEILSLPKYLCVEVDQASSLLPTAPSRLWLLHPSSTPSFTHSFHRWPCQNPGHFNIYVEDLFRIPGFSFLWPPHL